MKHPNRTIILPKPLHKPVATIKTRLSDYTKPELDRFRELCNFTDDELEYFNLRSKNTSNVAISLEMCISEAKVSILARNVKRKIKRIN